jgi:hypothetical protein
MYKCENLKQILICFLSEKNSHEPMENFWLNIDGSRTVDFETLNYQSPQNCDTIFNSKYVDTALQLLRIVDVLLSSKQVCLQ